MLGTIKTGKRTLIFPLPVCLLLTFLLLQSTYKFLIYFYFRASNKSFQVETCQ
jgi:hypothetical protein